MMRCDRFIEAFADATAELKLDGDVAWTVKSQGLMMDDHDEVVRYFVTIASADEAKKEMTLVALDEVFDPERFGEDEVELIASVLGLKKGKVRKLMKKADLL